MNTELQMEPGSFRDRAGRIFYYNGEVYRGLKENAYREWQFLRATGFFKEGMEKGKIVATKEVNQWPVQQWKENVEWKALLHHEKIPFISYPYEWCYSMLKDAALLQLELLQEALKENAILKDSTPYNVQWKGTQPVFIDVLSFEEWKPGQPWIGYLQFCQLYLYPLMLQAYKGIPFQKWLRGSIDGITPEEFNRVMSFRDLFRPGVFFHVFLHSQLQRSYARKGESTRSALERSGFHKELILTNICKLHRLVKKMQWSKLSSEWSDYYAQTSYQEEDQHRKRDFVRKSVHSGKWQLVWDLGCNVGTFSEIAAENAACVIAVDADPVAVEKFYRELKQRRNDRILPLVMNLADGSPGLGWRGLERKSFISRGKPDLVLCLALLHHLVISNNILLKDFIRWLADLDASVIIEFISKDDPMVQRLLLNKEDVYEDYRKEYFERLIHESFHIVDQQTLCHGTRTLYFLSPHR